MRVYVIRHGESVNNQKKLWTGWFDAPLSEKGENDAGKVREILKGLKFDKVYSSDLSRAKKTAEIALPNTEYEVTALIREMNVGALANTSTASLTDAQKAKIKESEYSAFGGESHEEFRCRIRKFLRMLEGSEEKTVAVFCHAGCAKVMLSEVLGIPLPPGKIISNNCMVAIFDYVNNTWKLHSWINME